MKSFVETYAGKPYVPVCISKQNYAYLKSLAQQYGLKTRELLPSIFNSLRYNKDFRQCVIDNVGSTQLSMSFHSIKEEQPAAYPEENLIPLEGEAIRHSYFKWGDTRNRLKISKIYRISVDSKLEKKAAQQAFQFDKAQPKTFVTSSDQNFVYVMFIGYNVPKEGRYGALSEMRERIRKNPAEIIDLDICRISNKQ